MMPFLFRIWRAIFNITFYPCLFITTAAMFILFFIPICAVRVLLGERRMHGFLRWIILVYGCVVIRVLAFPFVRIEFRDQEKERKRDACVYVCNHRSSSDGFLMALLKIEAVQVVNNWPFKIPIIGWVARLAGYLSVRTMRFEDFLDRGCQLLKEGVSLIAFPEGSRSPDTEVRQFNGAVFRVAQAAGVPVVPVCLSGNQMIPEKNTGILNPGKITVHKLPAVTRENYQDWSPFKLKNRVREIIQSEVNRLELPCP